MKGRPGRRFLAAVVCLLLLPVGVGCALQLLIAVGDNPHRWLREEAYRAAVDAALRDYDEASGDPSLPARDFTMSRLTRVPTFAPCPYAAGELRVSTALCSADPGPKPKPDLRLCRGGACVVLGVTPETWADPGARAAVLQALRDPRAVCRAATLFAANHKASAQAAGCGTRTRERVRLVVALVPRRPHPCAARPLPLPKPLIGPAPVNGPVAAYKIECVHAPTFQQLVS